MTKRVLDVGNCSMDHGAIRSMIERSFAADVVQAHGQDDALQLLAKERFDLVLVNRKLDQDYSDGMEVIAAIKARPEHMDLPCMLITNLPEHEAAAVAAGCEPGFGKRSLHDSQTRERLKRHLGT
jgi:CheY-like chemotaxis protein